LVNWSYIWPKCFFYTMEHNKRVRSVFQKLQNKDHPSVIRSNTEIILTRLDWFSYKSLRYESKGILVQAGSHAFLHFRYAYSITCSSSAISWDLDLQKVKLKWPPRFLITIITHIAENIHTSLNSKYILWCVLAYKFMSNIDLIWGKSKILCNGDFGLKMADICIRLRGR